MPPESKPTPETSFRESLKDLVVILDKLGPYCQSVEELTGMVALAVENDAQLRLLLVLMSGKR